MGRLFCASERGRESCHFVSKIPPPIWCSERWIRQVFNPKIAQFR